jgi:large subunit ribosomal protein L6
MSRLGKKPITIPQGVDFRIENNQIIVKGPKGEIKYLKHPVVVLGLENSSVGVSVQDPSQKHQKALWGTFVRLIKNMIEGVTNGFEKKLQLVGVGFKAQVTGDKLTLNVGFSHPVNYKIPSGVKISVEKDIVTVSGVDKQIVGEVAAQIRKIKKPEPYKGVGIRYFGESVRTKAGKKAAATGAAA